MTFTIDTIFEEWGVGNARTPQSSALWARRHALRGSSPSALQSMHLRAAEIKHKRCRRVPLPCSRLPPPDAVLVLKPAPSRPEKLLSISLLICAPLSQDSSAERGRAFRRVGPLRARSTSPTTNNWGPRVEQTVWRVGLGRTQQGCVGQSTRREAELFHRGGGLLYPHHTTLPRCRNDVGTCKRRRRGVGEVSEQNGVGPTRLRHGIGVGEMLRKLKVLQSPAR